MYIIIFIGFIQQQTNKEVILVFHLYKWKMLLFKETLSVCKEIILVSPILIKNNPNILKILLEIQVNINKMFKVNHKIHNTKFNINQ